MAGVGLEKLVRHIQSASEYAGLEKSITLYCNGCASSPDLLNILQVI